MPHSTLPYTGFQAVILCGPGASLDTFTSNPKDFPKALLPIANRPMVWYPLEWCYRMGITDITLVTPKESAKAIEAALAQNPHLTALPTSKPEVIAPFELTQTTGTGEIFKLPEVAKAITTDFLVLPCDLVCEIEGSSFLQTWMTLEAGLGGAGGTNEDGSASSMALGGERSGRRGGLSVWYPTKGLEGISTKAEQTDFIATVPQPRSHPPAPEGSLRPDVSKLVMSVPRSTVKDIIQERGAMPIRHMLLKQFGQVDMKTSYRDAHIYLFPRWVLEMIKRNEFESVAEDVIGWWAKAGWQRGLGDKLGLTEVLGGSNDTNTGDDGAPFPQLEDEVDLAAMSTTSVSRSTQSQQAGPDSGTAASRVPAAIQAALDQRAPPVPPILAYVQPSYAVTPVQPLIRRVDTSALLLSISLRLAKLPSVAECGAQGSTPPSPFAHAAKVAHPDMLQKQARVFEADSLVAENVEIGPRVNVKESVVGVGCTIGSGARITKCLLMDGVVVGEGVTLQGCILGRRCKVEGGAGKEDGTRLVDCEVQPGFVVEKGTEAKGEKFMAFEGLDDDGGEMDLDCGDDTAGDGIELGE